MPVKTAIETLARRDRLMVAAGLAAITVLAWVYLLFLAAGMDDM